MFYQNENVKAKVILGKETIWATKKEIVKIFNTTSKNINSHIQNIFKESEFEEFLTLRDFLKVPIGDNLPIPSIQKYYNFDAILSVGYRVNLQSTKQFRVWGDNAIKEKNSNQIIIRNIINLTKVKKIFPFLIKL